VLHRRHAARAPRRNAFAAAQFQRRTHVSRLPLAVGQPGALAGIEWGRCAWGAECARAAHSLWVSVCVCCHYEYTTNIVFTTRTHTHRCRPSPQNVLHTHAPPSLHYQNSMAATHTSESSTPAAADSPVVPESNAGAAAADSLVTPPPVPKNVQHTDEQRAMIAAAEEGAEGAMCALGAAYLEGLHGFQQDLTEAFKWMSAAAEKGSRMGRVACSQMLMQGAVPGSDDRVKAMQYMEKAAAEDGSVLAICMLAKCTARGFCRAADLDGAMKLLQALVDHGIPEGMHQLGELLITGTDGKPIDAAKGCELLEQAYFEGNADAAASLGIVVLEGTHCKQNLNRGKRLLEVALRLGNNTAQHYVQAMKEQVQRERRAAEEAAASGGAGQAAQGSSKEETSAAVEQAEHTQEEEQGGVAESKSSDTTQDA